MKVICSVLAFIAVLHSTFAIECKELWQKKDEMMNCCQEPHVVEIDQLQKCMEENKDKEKKQKFACTAKCVYDANGLMNGDEIATDKLLAKAEAINSDFKSTAVEIVNGCIQRMENHKAKHGQNAPEGCPPGPMFMSMCIGKGYMHKCPDDKWTKSEVCDKVRSGECKPQKRGGNGGNGGDDE
ncbi:general odorant-binding protein 68-like [Uranotaenia lowii]|uniref:general odorant-binding protein 68-like n=1 Tax=Uranotaenia lowii TaxID=190385 RepID=UPI00247AAD91|nr:general odorant-binding protein 68-like [Uranotaenia lowii]